MRHVWKTGLAVLALSACATPAPPITPGQTEQAVVAQLGRPSATYQLADGPEYEYNRGPLAQQAWMVRFDRSGRVLSARQVRSPEAFNSIRIGEARKKDVLETLGQPSETSRVFLNDYEVWSYRYKENDVWNSMMHVFFDHDGRVRMMQSGPDRLYDERRLDF